MELDLATTKFVEQLRLRPPYEQLSLVDMIISSMADDYETEDWGWVLFESISNHIELLPPGSQCHLSLVTSEKIGKNQATDLKLSKQEIKSITEILHGRLDADSTIHSLVIWSFKKLDKDTFRLNRFS